MEKNQFNFERVWHGSRRSHPAIAWPTYLGEVIFAIVVIAMMALELFEA